MEVHSICERRKQQVRMNMQMVLAIPVKFLGAACVCAREAVVFAEM